MNVPVGNPQAAASYRDKIYGSYVSAFNQREAGKFNKAAADQRLKVCRHFLRGWLPGNSQARLADLACGDGTVLYIFQQLGYANVSGVDISPEQIEIARQVTPDVTLGSVQDFLSAHSEDLDLITAFDLIEHFEKDEVLPFLEACYAALKPGGRLILQTPNAESPWGHSVRYADFTHEVAFTPGCLSKLQQLCGFTNLEVRENGPVPWGYSLKSTARACVWSGIRWLLRVWNLAEMGDPGSGVYTRVFLTSALKPQAE